MYKLIIVLSFLLMSCLTSTDTIHKTEVVTDTLTLAGDIDTVVLTEALTLYLSDTVYIDKSNGSLLIAPDTTILTQILTQFIDRKVFVYDTTILKVYDTVIKIEEVFDSTKMYEFFGEATFALCIDGIDNDNDGRPDCEDLDCSGTAACFRPNEITPSLCSDGLDNDGDELTDCNDPDCKALVMCSQYE